MNTGETVRKKRLEKHLSIRRLAEKSGVMPSTIYRIERRSSRPHIATLNALADALECTASDLVNS